MSGRSRLFLVFSVLLLVCLGNFVLHFPFVTSALVPTIIWILLIVFGVPAIFRWLWNILCPQIFRIPTLTYWQAFGILILAGLLFGAPHLFTLLVRGFHNL